jgi:hypothetical protein
MTVIQCKVHLIEVPVVQFLLFRFSEILKQFIEVAYIQYP